MRQPLPFLVLFALSLNASANTGSQTIMQRMMARLQAECEGSLSYTRFEGLSGLTDAHLADLMALFKEDGENKVGKILRASVVNGTRTGGKTYPLVEGYGDHFLKPLRAEIQGLLARLKSLPPSIEPYYFSIVGLGYEVAEFPVLVRLLDAEIVAGNLDPSKLNFRIGLYDVVSESLNTADSQYRSLSKIYPWLQNRVEVRYFDMSSPDFVGTWEHHPLALVMVRNSLRNLIVKKGWPLLFLVATKMVSGGFLAVDYEAHQEIIGDFARYSVLEEPLLLNWIEIFANDFQNAGKFGLESYNETYLIRKN